MSVQLKICCNASGTWSVQGLSTMPVTRLPSLSASLEYASNACDRAPATIELFVEGLYMVVHQERGWPDPLLSSETVPADSAPPRPDLGGGSMWKRFAFWLQGLRGWSAKASPAH